MTKHRKAEALSRLSARLRELSIFADENGLTTVFYMIEVAIMEAEYERTGEFPSLLLRPDVGTARLS
jgi:hypothetical protein